MFTISPCAFSQAHLLSNSTDSCQALFACRLCPESTPLVALKYAESHLVNFVWFWMFGDFVFCSHFGPSRNVTCAYIGTAHVDLEWVKPSKIGNEVTKDAFQIKTVPQQVIETTSAGD